MADAPAGMGRSRDGPRDMTDTSRQLELHAGPVRLALRPDLGAAIAGLWHEDLPVLRSRAPEELANVRDSGGYALVPYSNRLGWRRFHWLGEAHHTEPNFDGSPHSLHGLAWQRPWKVAAHSVQDAVLTLSHGGDGSWPFPFELRQSFTVNEQALELRLEFTNTAATPAPVGLGWHPYFPRRARSRLHAEVSGRWEVDAAKLPTQCVSQPGLDADVAHLQFDHCFEGWHGAVRIRDECLSLQLSSSLERLVVYTPQDADFFCVEPVSHVTNAINMGDPASLGLRTVQPGETTTAWLKLEIGRAR